MTASPMGPTTKLRPTALPATTMSPFAVRPGNSTDGWS